MSFRVHGVRTRQRLLQRVALALDVLALLLPLHPEGRVGEHVVEGALLALSVARVVNVEGAFAPLDAELLDEFLAIQVREILVHLFSWREGEYAFDEQDLEMKLEYATSL